MKRDKKSQVRIKARADRRNRSPANSSRNQFWRAGEFLYVCSPCNNREQQQQRTTTTKNKNRKAKIVSDLKNGSAAECRNSYTATISNILVAAINGETGLIGRSSTAGCGRQPIAKITPKNENLSS